MTTPSATPSPMDGDERHDWPTPATGFTPSVLVTGAPGAPRSELLRRIVTASRCRPLWIHGARYAADNAYASLANLAAPTSEVLPPALATAIREQLPERSTTSGLGPWLWSLISARLHDLCPRTIVVVDDLDAMDPATQDIARYALDTLAAVGGLPVVTACQSAHPTAHHVSALVELGAQPRANVDLTGLADSVAHWLSSHSALSRQEKADTALTHTLAAGDYRLTGQLIQHTDPTLSTDTPSQAQQHIHQAMLAASRGDPVAVAEELEPPTASSL